MSYWFPFFLRCISLIDKKLRLFVLMCDEFVQRNKHPHSIAAVTVQIHLHRIETTRMAAETKAVQRRHRGKACKVVQVLRLFNTHFQSRLGQNTDIINKYLRLEYKTRPDFVSGKFYFDY